MSKDSREKLIKATQDLLWERGYDGISPKDIQDYAGVGHGSMYHHFSGKHELARTAIENIVEEVLERLRKLLSSPGSSAIEKITELFERQTYITKGCKIGNLTRDHSIMCDDALRRPIERLFRENINQLRAVIQSGIDSGELSAAIDADAMAHLVVATVQGGKLCSKALGSSKPFNFSAKALLDLLQAKHQ